MLVSPPAAVAAARLTHRDTTSSVLMAQAFGPILALPALGALGLGALARRPGLAWVAAGVTALHLAWLTTDLRQAGTPTAAATSSATTGRRFRLFSANVLYTNTDLEGIAAEISAADPDVVLLQEVSPATLAGLDRAGTLDHFAYRSLAPRPDPQGMAILSRFPLGEVEVRTLAGMPTARATVVIGDHRLRLLDVHTRAPFGPGCVALWTAQLAALADLAGEETGPLILAGDFNAASGHRPFRALLATGLRDAHMARRRWWATTWRSDMRLAPPFALIDHVLVSRQIDVLSVSEGVGRGSDHRPVIADLVVTG